MIHGDTEQRLDPLPAPVVPRSGVIDELYDAVVNGLTTVHTGEWGMATLEGVPGHPALCARAAGDFAGQPDRTGRGVMRA